MQSDRDTNVHRIPFNTVLDKGGLWAGSIIRRRPATGDFRLVSKHVNPSGFRTLLGSGDVHDGVPHEFH
jgi:hypothetical protein